MAGDLGRDDLMVMRPRANRPAMPAAAQRPQMQLPKLLTVTVGATTYSFPLVDRDPVHVVVKPHRGDVIATAGSLTSTTRLEPPWIITDLKGLGVSRVNSATQEPDERVWEMQNGDRWRGMICIGPLAQSATDMTGVHLIAGFAEAIGVLFYFSSTSVASRETLAYWTGSSLTWTSCTATADFEASIALASGFPCAGMAEFQGAGVANLSAVALRTIAITNGGNYYQMIYSADKTTWSIINHVAAADTPAGNVTDACTGLVNLSGTLYTLSYNSTTKLITLRQSAGGTTWTSSAGGTITSSAAPRSLTVQNYPGGERLVAATQEGEWQYTGSAFVRIVDYRGDIQSNNGLTPVRWFVKNQPGGWNVSQQGKAIILQGWGGDASTAQPLVQNIGPSAAEQGLPGYLNGQVTALAAAPLAMLWAAQGGDSSATTAAIYKQYSDLPFPLGWVSIYNLGTANRQIRAMYYSTLDDGVPRLHWAEDNGAAGDTDPKFMENVTLDPRTVSGYKHAASCKILLPKNSRALPDLQGIWRGVKFTGTNLSANNQVAAVYASADVAPIGTDGAWGSSLGAVTANGGSVNFAGTPSGTGQSAYEMQLRFDLSGATNASPYIETVVVNSEKILPHKYIRIFTLDMRAPTGTQRGLSSEQKWLNVQSIISATTDLQVSYGQESNLVMNHWHGIYFADSNYVDYINNLLVVGTGMQQTAISELKLALVDV